MLHVGGSLLVLLRPPPVPGLLLHHHLDNPHEGAFMLAPKSSALGLRVE